MSDDSSISTRLIHHAYQPPAGFVAPQSGVFKASTVIFPNVAALQARSWQNKDGYTYGLHGTPTSFLLEERIATLEGGLQTLLVPSGLAAITLVDMALLDSGDEVLLPHNAYGPGKNLVQHELARWGITSKLYDAGDAGALEQLIGADTKLVWLEAAGSVTMEFPDLPALVRTARAKGVLSALDNTWGAGLAFNAFALGGAGEDLGVDISVHALTKFPSGGGDVLDGLGDHARSRAAPAPEGHAHAHGLGRRRRRRRVGAARAAVAGAALCRAGRGRTAAGALVAAAAAGGGGAAPGAGRLTRASNTGLNCARRQRACSRSSSMSVSAAQQVHAFVDALKLFKLGYSWAGPVSLAVPYELSAMRADAPWRGTLVRFSLGLEDVDDLQADLAAALRLLG